MSTIQRNPMRRIARLVLLCMNATVLASADPTAGEQPPAPPNVILITISSLRADHVGCLGYARPTTPRFDAFASRGMLFRNAFASSSWNMPTHGSIFTSRYPSEHGATHIDQRLNEQCRTLAEVLAGGGYYCAGFSCDPRLTHDKGFARGFHFYDDHSVPLLLEALRFDAAAPVEINSHRTNDLINDAAIAWLQRNTHRPFFLFVHYYDNHWDYLPPEPYRSLYDPNYAGPLDGGLIAREPLYSNRPHERDVRHMIALYDGEVRQTDEDLGEFLDALQVRGEFDRSLIVVLGDHGEQFYEHGNTSHHGLYDELTHIPLAVSIPGRSGGRTTDALVGQMDLAPTILDYVRIPMPDACRGASIRPLLEGRTEEIHPFLCTEYTGGAVPDMFAVRSGRYKCVWRKHEVFAYDLSSDPAERHILAPADWNGELETLRKALADWMHVLHADGPAPVP